jgi:hypothetical protein
MRHDYSLLNLPHNDFSSSSINQSIMGFYYWRKLSLLSPFLHLRTARKICVRTTLVRMETKICMILIVPLLPIVNCILQLSRTLVLYPRASSFYQNSHASTFQVTNSLMSCLSTSRCLTPPYIPSLVAVSHASQLFNPEHPHDCRGVKACIKQTIMSISSYYPWKKIMVAW